MRNFFLFFFGCIYIGNLFAQRNSKLLDSIVQSRENLKRVVLAKKKYRPQIIYTQINRDTNNKPTFTNHTYLLDSNNYFYCASLVKLPCSIFALEKINNLNINGLNKSSIMLTDSAGPCQHKQLKDTTSQNRFPSVEHHIKKMLLVSDNYSFSRIWEFLNPKYIQNRLSQLGYPRARIVHRLDAGCVGVGNKYFNPVSFVDSSNKTLYSQPADSLTEEFTTPFENLVLGRDIYSKRKRRISEKKDFTKSNFLSLEMIHGMMQKLVFMELENQHSKYNLSNSDWQFLMKHLGMYPRESEFPKNDPKTYYDSFKKYFIYGSAVSSINSDSLRIFNIVGRAYGFVIDCAYIVNFKTKTEFLLSSVIYTNKRNSFGTGKYEYDSIGLPFLQELSLALYKYECNRKKKFLPNLESVNFYGIDE